MIARTLVTLAVPVLALGASAASAAAPAPTPNEQLSTRFDSPAALQG